MNHRPAAGGYIMCWARPSSVVPMESHKIATENPSEIAQTMHINEYWHLILCSLRKIQWIFGLLKIRFLDSFHEMARVFIVFWIVSVGFR